MRISYWATTSARRKAPTAPPPRRLRVGQERENDEEGRPPGRPPQEPRRAEEDADRLVAEAHPPGEDLEPERREGEEQGRGERPFRAQGPPVGLRHQEREDETEDEH